MSSNKNHIPPFHISRANYEEYFLLYVDDELGAEQKAAVELFAAAHPDLQIELDMLLGAKLAPEAITMNKETLQLAYMQANDMEEAMLLYIDDELAAADKKAMEQRLASNKELQRQYQLLRQAQLEKNEEIVFAHKKELYHKTENVPLFGWWMRIAALLILILGAALFIVQQYKVAAPLSAAQHTTMPVKKAMAPKAIEQNSSVAD